jgi:uncharacterized protein (DUF1800 family)
MAASSTDAAVAVTRLGLGARPGEIARVAADPHGWALAQIRSDGAPQPDGVFQTTDQRMAAFVAYQAQTRQGDGADAEATRAARQAARRAITDDTAQAFLARARHGATTDQGFAERWALFWANALTVSAVKFDSGAFVDSYEREAIRPNVFGRFQDLVVAAEQHPAMLLYLDQARSTGPGSPAGSRRKIGLNENLAREMLELHPVGADAGYTQADVTELARALTGWSIPRPQESQGQDAQDLTAAFVFRANVHEPGPRTVMGKTYPAAGKAQGEAILRDLARHPATARRLSHRIATHFVADAPPPSLVTRLETAWTRSDGDLGQVARALVEAPETWAASASKIKTPYEFIISAHRALDVPPERLAPLRQTLLVMGQPPFAPPSPEGWPDTAADWAGPDALVKRLYWARSAAQTSRTTDVVATANDAIGERLSERTRLAVARVESRTEALTLLLMSPEFQRRRLATT